MPGKNNKGLAGLQDGPQGSGRSKGMRKLGEKQSGTASQAQGRAHTKARRKCGLFEKLNERLAGEQWTRLARVALWGHGKDFFNVISGTRLY